MKSKAPSRALPAAILVVSLLMTPPLRAQEPDAPTGTVTSPSGGGIANAVVSVKNLNTGAASDLYFTSAYFAIRAPSIKGTPTRGPIRVHKALAWIHGPGMILTPNLGALAYQQK